MRWLHSALDSEKLLTLAPWLKTTTRIYLVLISIWGCKRVAFWHFHCTVNMVVLVNMGWGLVKPPLQARSRRTHHSVNFGDRDPNGAEYRIRTDPYRLEACRASL